MLRMNVERLLVVVSTAILMMQRSGMALCYLAAAADRPLWLLQPIYKRPFRVTDLERSFLMRYP